MGFLKILYLIINYHYSLWSIFPQNVASEASSSFCVLDINQTPLSTFLLSDDRMFQALLFSLLQLFLQGPLVAFPGELSLETIQDVDAICSLLLEYHCLQVWDKF